MSLKWAPKGKQSRLYISSYSGKRLDCIYLLLKCKCHCQLKRRSAVSEDHEPRNERAAENCTRRRAHIHFTSQQFLPSMTRRFLPRQINQQQIEIYIQHCRICFLWDSHQLGSRWILPDEGPGSGSGNILFGIPSDRIYLTLRCLAKLGFMVCAEHLDSRGAHGGKRRRGSRADARAEDAQLRPVFGIFRAVCPLWSD